MVCLTFLRYYMYGFGVLYDSFWPVPGNLEPFPDTLRTTYRKKNLGESLKISRYQMLLENCYKKFVKNLKSAIIFRSFENKKTQKTKFTTKTVMIKHFWCHHLE